MDPMKAAVGILISAGIGSAAIRVVVAPATVPARTIRASLFSDTSISSTKQVTSKRKNGKNCFVPVNHVITE